MKNQLKNDNPVTINTLILLILYCTLALICIAMMSYLLGCVIVYLKIGFFVFEWKENIFDSLRIGVAAGVPTGIGIWIKAKLEERKRQKN